MNLEKRSKVKQRRSVKSQPKARKVKERAKSIKLQPYKFSLINKTGSWKTYKPVVNYKECIKCGRCWMFCPEGCIKKNKDGYFVPDLDYCKGCGICANECPKKCIKMVLEEK